MEKEINVSINNYKIPKENVINYYNSQLNQFYEERDEKERLLDLYIYLENDNRDNGIYLDELALRLQLLEIEVSFISTKINELENFMLKNNYPFSIDREITASYHEFTVEYGPELRNTEPDHGELILSEKMSEFYSAEKNSRSVYEPNAKNTATITFVIGRE